MITNKKYPIAIGFLITVLLAGIVFSSCNRQVSVTPPDAPPPNGTIYLNTDPTGFQINLDGKPQRRLTPDSLKWLGTGQYTITLKKNLFNDSTFTVNVVEGQKTNVFIDFAHSGAMLGSIFCDSNPEGAQIFINDSSTGSRTPASIYGLLPGVYTVKLHLENHRDYLDTVTVRSRVFSKVNAFLIDTTIWRDFTTANSPIQTNNLTCVNVDKNDVVWIGTAGYAVISFDGNVWGGKEIYPLLDDKNINCIAVDNNNMKFFGSNRGFLAYDGTSSFLYGFKSSGLPDFFIEALGCDNLGNWYIGTREGLTRSFEYNNIRYWQIYPDSLVPDPIISCILCDSKNNAWIGLNSKGLVEKKAGGGWDWTTKNNSHIISDNVRALAESPTGEIWVGFSANVIYGSGLSYYNGVTWQNVNAIPATSQTNAIYIDKNNTKWIATDQGLVKFTSGSNYTLFNYNNTGVHIDDATGVASDSKGNLWISTYGGGLIEYLGNH